jgi:hypothetical protein
MTRSPLLEMVLAFLSESGKSSRVFAKNSVKKFASERMVGECELVVKLICAATKFPCLQAAKAVCRLGQG